MKVKQRCQYDPMPLLNPVEKHVLHGVIGLIAVNRCYVCACAYIENRHARNHGRSHSLCSGGVVPEGGERRWGEQLGVGLGRFGFVMEHVWRLWSHLGASWPFWLLMVVVFGPLWDVHGECWGHVSSYLGCF